MAGALPFIQGALGLAQLYQTFNQPKAPEAPPVLTYDQATKQAGDVINPQYQEQMTKTMNALDNVNLSRGFYGQAAGDAIKSERAADVERDRIAALSGLANQMVGQSQDNAYRYAALATQNAQQNSANRLSTLGNLFTQALDYPLQYANTTGYTLGGSPTTASRATMAGNAGNVVSSGAGTTATLNGQVSLPGNWASGSPGVNATNTARKNGLSGYGWGKLTNPWAGGTI
jgi:hypothetical protein